MTISQRQGEFLIAHGIDRATVARAWTVSAAGPASDLVAVLLHDGHISPELAAAARAAASGAGGAPGVRRPLASGSDSGIEDSRIDSGRVEPGSAGIPGYQLIRTLGAGGMGRVILAADQQSGAEVVIKVLSGDRSGSAATPRAPATPADGQALVRFEREAQALAAVRHPNIVRIHRAGRTAEGPYLVMERIHGRSLNELTKDARDEGALPLDPGRLKRWFADLAEALQALHRVDIVHRDVKPDNVMIEAETDRLVLVDLGLSRRLSSEPGEAVESLTLSGQIVGTPGYMAPEQLEKNGRFGAITPATDVWGLAATLFFALTGRPPIQADTLLALSARLATTDPPRPSRALADAGDAVFGKVDPVLESVCAAALRRRQSLRPSLEDLRAALLESRPLRLRAGRPRPRTLALLIAIPALVLLALLLRDTERPRVVVETRSWTTTRRRVRVEGRVLDASPKLVKIAGKSFPVHADGRFRASLELAEGRHELSVHGVDAAGNESDRLPIVVTVDRTPPTLHFQPPRRRPDGRWELVGRCSEPGCLWQLLDRRGEVVDGDVVVRLDNADIVASPTLTLRDPAGHEVRVPLPIHSVRDAGELTQRLGEHERGVLLIPPGTYTVNMEGRRELHLCAREPGRTTLRAPRGAAMLKLVGGRVVFEDMILEAEPDNAVLLEVEGGELVLRGVTLRAGRDGIQARPDSATGAAPKIHLERSQFTASRTALGVTEGLVRATRCRFHGRSGLIKAGCMIDLLGCPDAVFTGCSMGKATDSSVAVRHSDCLIELSAIREGLGSGVNLQGARTELLGALISRNSGEAVAAEHHTRARLAACEIDRNGIPGEPLFRGLRAIYGGEFDVLSADFERTSAAINTFENGTMRLRRVPGLEPEDLYITPLGHVEYGGQIHDQTPRPKSLSLPALERLLTTFERGPPDGYVSMAPASYCRVSVAPWPESIVRRVQALLGRLRGEPLSQLLRLIRMHGPTAPSIAPALLADFESKVDPVRRMATLQALGAALDEPALLNRLVRLLSRLRPVAAAAVVDVLLKHGARHAEQRRAIFTAIRELPPGPLRRSALRRLDLGGPAALATVDRLLDETRPRALLEADRRALAHALPWLGEAGEARLESLLSCDDPVLQRRVLLLLTGRPRSRALVTTALGLESSRDALLRAALATSLPWLESSPRVDAALARLARDGDELVSDLAARSQARLEKWQSQGDLPKPQATGPR